MLRRSFAMRLYTIASIYGTRGGVRSILRAPLTVKSYLYVVWK